MDLSNDESERPSCPFGHECYRNNPNHRLEQAHPGDDDYSVLRMPSTVEGAPKCKYGRQCYRVNPEHFQNFQHPRTNRMVQRPGVNDTSLGDSDDSYDADPFAGDSGGSDYVPSEDDE